MYHSWLTFVLLIWANALWMIPNQRKTMLRSSPFIVFYAELLLIAQYIYGMDLTDEELPSSVEVSFSLTEYFPIIQCYFRGIEMHVEMCLKQADSK